MSNNLRIMSVLQLQNRLLKHQERLAAIYHEKQHCIRSDTKKRQNELSRLHKNKELSNQLKERKTLDKINYENEIIHNKIIGERQRESDLIKSIKKTDENKMDVSVTRRKQSERINIQNLRMIQKLASARANIQQYKLKQHENFHSVIADRLCKRSSKKRKFLKDFMVNYYNIAPNCLLPHIKRDKDHSI